MQDVTKLCARCHIRKELSQFYKDRRSADGKRSYCKSCDMRAIQESRQRDKAAQARNLEIVEEEYQKSLNDLA